MNVLNMATADVITVAPADSIDKAISLMDERSVHHLIVVNQDNWPVGLVSDRDILISTGWRLAVERRVCNCQGAGRTMGPTRVEQIMSRPVVALHEKATARQVAALMRDRHIGAVPIVHNDKLAAIVTVHDLISSLDEYAADHAPVARFLESPVRERMSSPVLPVTPESSLDEIVSLFQRFNIHHVPVAVNDKLVGIVSDRDVRRSIGWSAICDQQADAGANVAHDDSTVHAAEVMNREVITIAPQAPLRQALRRMVFHRIHSLPVVQDHRLIGIITPTDFVKVIAMGDLI